MITNIRYQLFYFRDVRVVRVVGVGAGVYPQSFCPHRQRFIVSIHFNKGACKLTHARANVRMILRQHSFAKGQRLLLQLQRILVAAEITICDCKVMHARANVRMILRQGCAALTTT